MTEEATLLGHKHSLDDLFDGFRMLRPSTKKRGLAMDYDHAPGEYQFLGMPGSIDIKQWSALHCTPKPAVIEQVQPLCRNGVVAAFFLDHSVYWQRQGLVRVSARDSCGAIEIPIAFVPYDEYYRFNKEADNG